MLRSTSQLRLPEPLSAQVRLTEKGEGAVAVKPVAAARGGAGLGRGGGGALGAERPLALSAVTW